MLLPGSDSAKSIEIGAQVAARAEELFRQGLNCCESIIKAGIEVFQLPLPEDTYRIGRFFRQGIAESGCICGALAGGIMMLGYLADDYNKDIRLAEQFRTEFVSKFGTTCCRVIRQKQSFTGKLRNRECREITGFSAGLLYEILNSRGDHSA